MSARRRPLIRRLHGVMFKLPYMITCEAFEDFVLAYLEDELPPRQKWAFEFHLRLCRECREYLYAYRTALAVAVASGREAPVSLPDHVPDDLVAAVVAAVHR